MSRKAVILFCSVFAAVSLTAMTCGTRETHGFSAEIPKNWTCSTKNGLLTGTMLTAVSPDKVVLQISSAPGSVPLSTLKELLKRTLSAQYSPKGKIKTSECSVSGTKGVCFLFTDQEGYRVRYSAVPFGTRTFAVITVTPPGKSFPGEDTLLNSIRFIPE